MQNPFIYGIYMDFTNKVSIFKINSNLYNKFKYFILYQATNKIAPKIH